MLQEVVQFFKDYPLSVAALVAPLGIAPFIWQRINVWLTRRESQKQAAAELVGRTATYRLQWIEKHYDDENARPDPESEFQWPGATYDRLLDTPALQSIAARLAPRIRNRVFRLNALADKWRISIGVASDTWENMDVIGPLSVAELAVEADEVLGLLCHEADMDVPETGHSVAQIETFMAKKRLEKAEHERDEEKTNRKFAELNQSRASG